MTSIAHSFVFTKDPQLLSFSGSTLKPLEQYPVKCRHINLSLSPIRRRNTKSSSYKSSVTIRAGGDGGRPSSASIFVGGFVLGGIIVGTLGCVYAPQISKALAGADRKDLMRKLPKFIYDEEKALEKTRKILTEKIAQLNSAIDDVSSQLRADDSPNGAAVNSDEVEAAI
ncbi:inner membrane localized protein [Tasmannia lanceolata]|uniref:inner membrane localized protein n=1 Tax=Tasmannia lanceolata TaxID=3420 RepID=UPI0040628528